MNIITKYESQQEFSSKVQNELVSEVKKSAEMDSQIHAIRNIALFLVQCLLLGFREVAHAAFAECEKASLRANCLDICTRQIILLVHELLDVHVRPQLHLPPH